MQKVYRVNYIYIEYITDSMFFCTQIKPVLNKQNAD